MIKLVTSTLSSVGVPVVFQAFPAGSRAPGEYITFIEYGTSPSIEASDQEITTERLVQVNVWTKGNYHSLVKKVRQTLENEGFERVFEYDAPYSDGDSHFNKVLRFRFTDEY